MPSARLLNRVELSFDDSGPVSGSRDYTTMVMYHGMTFNKGIFQKMLPHAAAHNLRIIIPNRRGYAGSTPYTEGEIASLHAGDKAFYETQASDVANFLLWIIDNQGLPELKAERTSGGVVLFGWSSGATCILSFLANPSVVTPDLQRKLDAWLSHIFIYDGTSYSFGHDVPSGGYIPTEDPTLTTPEDIGRAFNTWVSCYWTHPNISEKSVDGLERQKKLGSDVSSIANMSSEEISSTMDVQSGMKVDLPTHFPPSQPTLRAQAASAFYDDTLAHDYLPQVQITYLAALSAPWVAVWTYIVVENEDKDNRLRGVHGRPVKFVEIPGANHFLHWDDPRRLVEVIVESFRAPRCKRQ